MYGRGRGIGLYWKRDLEPCVTEGASALAWDHTVLWGVMDFWSPATPLSVGCWGCPLPLTLSSHLLSLGVIEASPFC